MTILTCWLLGCSNPKEQKQMSRLVPVCARTAVQKFLEYNTGKNIIQPSGTTISNFSDNVVVLRAHENCGRFATLCR